MYHSSSFANFSLFRGMARLKEKKHPHLSAYSVIWYTILCHVVPSSPFLHLLLVPILLSFLIPVFIILIITIFIICVPHSSARETLSCPAK